MSQGSVDLSHSPLRAGRAFFEVESGIFNKRCLDYARHKGKENEVFSRIIRTPFGVLLPFVPEKRRALHHLSSRQIVAHQEGNLTSKTSPSG